MASKVSTDLVDVALSYTEEDHGQRGWLYMRELTEVFNVNVAQ